MGLSGRKEKQRIPKDPRNLSWADDAARFGSNYLSKFGWDSSKGLGAGGDGMKSHIKVSHKLDMLGIGAGQQKDPNGIAWKQNKDFENLLRRLNENLAAEKEAAAQKEAEESAEESSEGEKAKKRKHRDTEEETHTKKKKKTEVKIESSEQMNSIEFETTEIVEEVSVEIKRPVIPRHRAHRARAIAAKNIASKSAAHISEILGIAPGLSTVPSSTSQGKLTSVTDTDALGMDKITTSTKCVADYFKDKLLLRSFGLNNSATPSSSASTMDGEDDEREAPRMGLGASRFQMGIHTETKVEEETQRMGLSKFSSLMSSSFLASASSFSSFVPTKVENDEDTAHISQAESEPSKKKEKKKSKKRSKVVEEEDEDEVKEEDEKRKKKRDRKGKNKEISPDEDEGTTLGEKKKKKSKKSKVLVPDEDSTLSTPAEEEIDPESQKKENRKHKSEKSEGDSKKLRKEKKKHRSSDGES